eukprot:6664547-Prymnesium_polylepis.1
MDSIGPHVQRRDTEPHQDASRGASRALELIRENFDIPEEAFQMASSMLPSWDYDVIALEVHSAQSAHLGHELRMSVGVRSVH